MTLTWMCTGLAGFRAAVCVVSRYASRGFTVMTTARGEFIQSTDVSLCLWTRNFVAHRVHIVRI